MKYATLTLTYKDNGPDDQLIAVGVCDNKHASFYGYEKETDQFITYDLSDCLSGTSCDSAFQRVLQFTGNYDAHKHS